MKIKQADNIAILLSSMLQVKGIVGYKIARNLRMINEELKEYNSIKQELFSKYGELQDDRYVIKKDSENYSLFLKEIEPYENQEVEFNFKKVNDDELQNADLTAEQILILSDIMLEE